jgi:hypothetical protein
VTLIQVQFGGIYRLVHPDAELIAEAQKIVDTFQENYSTREWTELL